MKDGSVVYWYDVALTKKVNWIHLILKQSFKMAKIAGSIPAGPIMIIDVKVKPNARECKVEEKDGVYAVFVKAKPEKGKANREAVKLLEEHFGKKAKIISGLTSRKKRVEIGD